MIIGIGFVAYSPLGRGFLTGRFRTYEDLPANDFRRNSPRFQGENLGTNLGLVAQIERVAKAKGVSAGQIALAWVLAQGEDVIPIPGSKRRERLEENAAAADIQLTAEELSEIDALLPPGIAAGTRYPEAGMRAVNR